MTHLLLFYRTTFYTLGFAILGFTLYTYIKTRDKRVKAFLFLWSTMTATAALYVIKYYSFLNFNINTFIILTSIQAITICLIAIALPYFVHKIFNIKSRVIIFVFTGVTILTPLLLLPDGEKWKDYHTICVMSLITISNIYSYIVSFKNVLLIEKRKDKNLGLLFMFTFILFFGVLFYLDIYKSSFIARKEGFLFFPLFYMWIGGFCIYIGLTRLNLGKKSSERSIEGFITKYKLTNRESEIALLLAEGLTYKAISEKLCISGNTVNSHVKKIYEKSGTNNKTQLSKEISEFKG